MKAGFLYVKDYMTKENKSSNSGKNVIFAVFRQACYFFVIIAEVFLLSFLASVYHEKTFAENFVVERIQLGLLILSAIAFLLQGIFTKGRGHLMYIFSGICAFAAMRECDKFFDEALPMISWKIAYVFPLAGIIYGLMHKDLLKNQIIEFLKTPAFNMMCMVMIIVVPIAQCVGHRPFVKNVLGDMGVANIKEFFEECLETIGYTILLLSAVESYFVGKKK